MATSKLQRLFGDLLDRELPEYTIRENYRPDWLISSDNTRLELDFYIEELRIAFEVQGEQHYIFTPFFHKNMDDFEKRKRFDEEKRDLCYGNGIKLFEIFTQTDCEIAIKNIQEKYAQKPKFHYQVDGKIIEMETDFPISKRKYRKLLKNIDPIMVKKQAIRARKNLELFEKGELDATDEKVLGWKDIINRANVL